VIEDGFGPTRLHCQIAFDRRFDALMALGGKLLLVRFGPHFLANKIGPQARNRFFLPMSLYFVSRAIA
jgi:hypothetical protein